VTPPRTATPGTFLDLLDGLTPGQAARLIGSLSIEEADAADGDWPSWAHRGQRAPEACADGTPWSTWVIKAGRGFGKRWPVRSG
jgi:hypothetical protein